MKRIIAAILSFAILLTLTACGQAKQEKMEVEKTLIL